MWQQMSNENVNYDGSDDDDDDESFSFFENLTFSMVRGLTVPFPALRRVILYPSRKNKILSIGLSTKEGLLAVLAYLSIGVIAYHRVVERFSVADSLYFTAVCFSTVGFGDLVPTNGASRLFTTVFGLGGIAFLGAALATIGGRVVQAEREAWQSARRASRDALWRLFDGRDVRAALSDFRHQADARKQWETLQLARVRHKRERDALTKKNRPVVTRWDRAKRMLVTLLPPVSLIAIGGLITNLLEGRPWSFLQSFYFALMTASTIGFGDFAPQTRNGRLFAVVYIPLAVAAAGEIFSSIALAFIEKRQQEIFESELSTDLSMAHLNAMDSNGDGMITREEYIAFMLLEMGRLDTRELKILQGQFEQLDVNKSGYLDREDLKLMAQLRGRRVVE